MEPNERQHKAITKTEGPCIILAGAGTGKSFTVVEKVNHLVNTEQKFRPDEILCLTFSNEATDSLKTKIQDRLQTSVSVTVKTFHSFCQDVLREDGHLVSEDFEIILPDDAKILMHKDLGISPYWSNRYVTTIHTARDFGISLEDIKQYFQKLDKNLKQLLPENPGENADKLRTELQTLHLQPQNTKEERKEVRERKKEITQCLEAYDEWEKFRDFIEAWQNYDKLKQEKNYVDFADLNNYALQLFRQYGAEKYVNQYKYVFVDEFQDTNKLQFELIEYIAQHHNITVVGDPNQSIYGFRGAYKENFDHFKQSFNVQQDDLVELDKSYRSTNKILNLAHQLIQNNYENPDECVKVQNIDDVEGDDVNVVELVNRDEEARFVADKVQEAIDNGVPKEEICVLHRTHQQAQVLKQVFELKGIPVISAGKQNLLQKPEIRTTVSYLSILANLIERSGFGEQSWWNLFHYQNSLSPEDSVKIGRFLKKKRDEGVAIDEAMLDMQVTLSVEGQKIVKRITDKLRQLWKSSNKTLPELVFDVYEVSGLNRAFTHERSVENIEALMNLKKFYELAENYYNYHEKDITGFIKYIEIIDSLGVNVEASKVMDVDAVRLMTMHAVKGLEFDTVIVSNMAQGRFPLTRTQNEPLIPKEINPNLKDADDVKKVEKELLLYDERRLCYVSWTRAKRQLVITYARYYNDKESSESVFLDEVDYVNNTAFVKDEQETSSVVAPDSTYEQYKAGLKQQLIDSLDTESFNSIVERLMDYIVCREKRIPEFDFGSIKLDNAKFQRHLARCNENKSLLVFNPKYFVFTPTSLITYESCPKKYELSQLYRMPEPGDFEVTGASVGSFVHWVCEEGVNQGLQSLEEYFKLAEENLEEGIDLDDVKQMLTVFWERNKNKIGNSRTEVELAVEIGGYKFFGKADRIDTLQDGSVEIIDYKTNKRDIGPDERAIQLGFYAIAARKLGMKVSKLTLDMLRLAKPVEMEVDENGNVSCGRMRGFSLEDVENRLIEDCKAVANDYEHEFEVTDKDDNCRFCGYKFYCPKWVE